MIKIQCGKCNAFTREPRKKRVDYPYEHLLIQDHENAMEDMINAKRNRSQINKVIFENDKNLLAFMKSAYFVLKSKISFELIKKLYFLFFLLLKIIIN